VEAQQPGLRVAIAGYHSELLNDWPLVERNDRIAIHGGVEDVAPLYDSALCVVAPTRIAAGLAWKATETLSFGVPLVASSLIADQLGPGGTEIALTADQPSDFAAHIVSLALDEALWSRQRSRGLAYTEKWQSPSVFEKSIALALDAADSAMSARRNLAS
jgi:O-antigen biosynthesis protein